MLPRWTYRITFMIHSEFALIGNTHPNLMITCLEICFMRIGLDLQLPPRPIGKGLLGLAGVWEDLYPASPSELALKKQLCFSVTTVLARSP